MSSPRVTTVLLPPAKGRSIGGDSRWLISRGMPREVSCDDKTGENSRPTIGEDSTPAHNCRRLVAQRHRCHAWEGGLRRERRCCERMALGWPNSLKTASNTGNA